MIHTRVGYAGGNKNNPTYSRLGDHTETVQVDFDPRRVSYAELLAIFWKSHDPGGTSWRRQYMNAVFFHTNAQRQLALQTKSAIERETGGIVHTKILPVKSFYRAEDYHQKYILNRRSDLSGELSRIYPHKRDYVNSTAVARLNSYVGGYGTKGQLMGEIDTLGLSPESQRMLLKIVGE